MSSHLRQMRPGDSDLEIEVTPYAMAKVETILSHWDAEVARRDEIGNGRLSLLLRKK